MRQDLCVRQGVDCGGRHLLLITLTTWILLQVGEWSLGQGQKEEKEEVKSLIF